MLGFLKEAGRDWVTGLKRMRCDRPSCGRSVTVGYLKSRGAGLHMGTAWYCSFGCFQPAVEEECAAMLGTRQPYSSSRPLMTLGLELMGRGLLTPEQLRSHSEQILATETDAGTLLVTDGHVSESQVTAARARIWGCPVYNPPAVTIRPGIHIPRVFTASSLVVPIHYLPATRQLLLGFLRSVDYELMFAVEKMTRCTAKACFVKPSDYERYDESTQQKVEEASEAPTEMTFDEPLSATERARIVCNYCVGLGTDRVKITLCKNYLWARLQGGAGTCDLLFKVD